MPAHGRFWWARVCEFWAGWHLPRCAAACWPGVSVRSRTFARLVAPALSFVKATPVACVVVLLLIWLGSARVSIAAVFLMALPGVYFSLVEGLAQVDKPLEQMFRLHGVRGWRLFLRPYLARSPAVCAFVRPRRDRHELEGRRGGGVDWHGGWVPWASASIRRSCSLRRLTCWRGPCWSWRPRGHVSACWCGCCGLRVPWRGAWPCGRMGMDCAGVRGPRAMALRRSLRLPWAIARPGRRRWTVWCFSVPTGGRTCVMGASGVGKSTLLALAAGECAPCSMVFQDARLVEDSFGFG